LRQPVNGRGHGRVRESHFKAREQTAARTCGRKADQTEPLKTPLTVHNLLTHTAGLTYGFNQDILSQAYGENRLDFGQQAGGLEATANRLAAQPLLFQPGSRWHYSVATDVVGRVVEVVSGQPLDRFFKTTFSAPWRCATRASPFLRPRWAG
jgi:CubicO group peptidase (beta-lactamase class C family)